MQFRIHHLLLVISVFAASLASGFPGELLTPRPVWQIVSFHQRESNGNSRPAAHPKFGHAMAGRDYIATVQNGSSTQAINIGDTAVIDQHGLQLPEIGTYVIHNRQMLAGHGELPITSVNAPSKLRSVLPIIFSLLCSIALVIGLFTIRWLSRRQILLHRERRMIDRATRTAAST